MDLCTLRNTVGQTVSTVCFFQNSINSTIIKFGVLVAAHLTNWKKTPGKTGKLHSHFSTSQYQARAVEFVDEFLQTTSEKAKLVNQHINSSRAKQVKENQRKLASIASAILMCGWQWIDLRSHQDDSSDVANDLDRSHGNFLALLQYRACGGNSILDDHFNSCAGNVIYTSKTIQNELIMICSHLIRGLILEEVREAWFYIVIADEATNLSNFEQLPISVRFLDSYHNPQEYLSYSVIRHTRL